MKIQYLGIVKLDEEFTAKDAVHIMYDSGCVATSIAEYSVNEINLICRIHDHGVHVSELKNDDLLREYYMLVASPQKIVELDPNYQGNHGSGYLHQIIDQHSVVFVKFKSDDRMLSVPKTIDEELLRGVITQEVVNIFS